MIRCRTCLYPNTKPDLHFDESGECSACRSFKARKVTDWQARYRSLVELLDRHKGRCIVASSGGKDSTYIAMTLKNMGVDVTAVTATTCHLTPIGRLNIDNLARHVRTIEVTPNMEARAKLNRLSLEILGDASWPEHVSIHRVPFRMAQALGHTLIMYGECPQEAYGGPPGTEATMQMTQRWASEFGGFLGYRASDFVGKMGLTERDMRDYECPSDAELRKSGIEAHFLGQYIEWDSKRNGIEASRAGMKFSLPSPANWWPEENLDNAQTGLHDYLMYRKFGYGRGCAQMSVDIRKNLFCRELGLDWVRKCDGKFSEVYAGVPIADVLNRIGMTRKELDAVIDKFTNWEVFRQVTEETACSQSA